jgi:phosphoglycolate phosphatase-like HAD superfamily hydrolase
LFNRRQSGADSNHILILDLDNTLTDTRSWFADFILESTAELASAFMTDTSIVNTIYAEVASTTTLHEYAFAVEAISSKLSLQRSLSFKTIEAAAEKFWQRFAQAHPKINLYDGVIETLKRLRAHTPDLKMIILTDSPEWVALQRLSITGILPLVDGVVAIKTEEPSLRHQGYRGCIEATRQRIEAAMANEKTEHLILNLALPAKFAKPSSAGIELIRSRLGAMPGQLIICGDKDSKEGKAAAHWRKRQEQMGTNENPIHFIRANYGNHDLNHPRYAELSKQISSLASPAECKKAPEIVPIEKLATVTSSIERFEQLPALLNEILDRTGSRIVDYNTAGSYFANRANGRLQHNFGSRITGPHSVVAVHNAILATR